MTKPKLKLNLNEQNELAFNISIEGWTSDANSTKPNIRFLVSEFADEAAWVYPTQRDNEGFVVVKIPENKLFSEEKSYEGKLEVILGNHYFVPTEVDIEFIKPLKVEAVVVSNKNKKDLIKEDVEDEDGRESVKVSAIEIRKRVMPNENAPSVQKAQKRRSWNDLTKSEQRQIVEYRKQQIIEEKSEASKNKISLTKEYLKDILADSLKD